MTSSSFYPTRIATPALRGGMATRRRFRRPLTDSLGAPRPGPMGRRRTTAGIALIEVLISVLLLGIVSGAALSCLTSANRMAEVNRSRNSAAALCQERIDEMVASPFSPPSRLPACFGNSGTFWPPPATDMVTSTESVQVHTDPNGAGTVGGTRTTRVSMADATLQLVRVTARVNYTYRGVNYVCESYTLRSPD